MARHAWKAASASASLPWATSTLPILSCEMERSRCHWVLSASAFARRSLMLREAWKAASASARLPWATSTSPILLCDTERSRCPLGVVGVAFGQTFGYGAGGLEGGERVGEPALIHEHAADLVMRYGEVALPLGVVGVGLGQAFGDGEGGLEGGERVGDLALRYEHVAAPVMRYGEVVLPLGVVGVGLGQTFGYGAGGLEGGERVGELALGYEHVADPIMRYGEVPLPLGVVGVGLGQALGLLSGGPVGRKRLPEAAARFGDIAEPEPSPVAVLVRWQTLFEGQEASESLLGCRQIAGLHGQPAALRKGLYIAGIERSGLRIGLPRLPDAAQRSEGADVAPVLSARFPFALACGFVLAGAGLELGFQLRQVDAPGVLGQCQQV